MENWQMLILGLYTLVYIIVFFIQRSQIKSNNDIINSMKSFIEIFKIDEVKRFVRMKEETLKMAMDKFTHEQGVEFAKDKEGYIEKLLNKELKNTANEFQKKYDEVCECTYNLILKLPSEKRIEFINENLPLSKEDFLEVMKEYNELPKP